MDKKVGVYICSGCGIGDAIDVEQLAKVAKAVCPCAKTTRIFVGPKERRSSARISPRRALTPS